MKLLEIKNNLVKISFNENDKITLAKFIALVDAEKSYVAQIVNIKSEPASSYAIARLIFTFNNEGILDNYDGSTPSIQSQLSYLNSEDIIKLLPIEKPVSFGYLAQQNIMFKADATIFEKNLLICAEKFDHVYTLIKNTIPQLEKYKEKVVIIDTDHTFSDVKPTRFRRDFKLPLNAQMIDYIYENDMTEVDATSKAVIQDIFHEVREYTKTVDGNFIPFDTFVNVVSEQYKQTEIPELALLKHKLLKYQEENVFAQTKEEIDNLKHAIQSNETLYIDAAEISGTLQREVISHIFNILNQLDEYINVFVKLSNNNADKKLLVQILESDHIFTSVICSHNYKYVSELKQRAANIILFAPQTLQHDFASYNTLLNKLNANEFIIYGELTQDVPFIIELSDFSQNTEEEPQYTEEQPAQPSKENTMQIPEQQAAEESSESGTNSDSFEFIQPDEHFEIPADPSELTMPETSSEDINEITIPEDTSSDITFEEFTTEPSVNELSHEELVEQVAKDVDEVFYTAPQPEPSIDDITSQDSLTEEDLDFIDDLSPDSSDNQFEVVEDLPFEDKPQPEEPVEEEVITEIPEPVDIPTEFEIDENNNNDDLNEQQPPVVPVYPSEEPVLSDDAPQFEQGDTVSHPKYGTGVIEKLIKYGNKTLCSISFENVGRRLLDPAISELQKI